MQTLPARISNLDREALLHLQELKASASPNILSDVDRDF